MKLLSMVTIGGVLAHKSEVLGRFLKLKLPLDQRLTLSSEMLTLLVERKVQILYNELWARNSFLGIGYRGL